MGAGQAGVGPLMREAFAIQGGELLTREQRFERWLALCRSYYLAESPAAGAPLVDLRRIFDASRWVLEELRERASAPAPGVRRVVVVDDQQAVANCFSVYLASRGLFALPAYEGLTGLAAVAALEPDVAVVNLKMPGLPGTEVLRAIREDPRLRRMKVILTSTSPGAAGVAKSHRADGFLLVPCQLGELWAAVALALSR